MVKPTAVLISDIHFSVPNLTLASSALTQAIDRAKRLSLPLIIAGDLTDTKAIIRGEVANALIEIFKSAKGLEIVVLTGNHDLINMKASAHTLNFLRPYTTVIDTPQAYRDSLFLIPYQVTTEAFREAVKPVLGSKRLIIAHQGVKGAFMGEYVKDDSSIDPSELSGLRVTSGHYHKKQDIQLPKGGKWSYIGAPYSITAAEANDGPKGFCVLHSDGELEQIPTNLRKHVTIERDVKGVLDPIPGLMPDDLLWLKVKGPYTELEALKKKEIGIHHLGHSNFKLDRIYTDTRSVATQEMEALSEGEILDQIIDQTKESPEKKEKLKALWREVFHASH